MGGGAHLSICCFLLTAHALFHNTLRCGGGVLVGSDPLDCYSQVSGTLASKNIPVCSRLTARASFTISTVAANTGNLGS